MSKSCKGLLKELVKCLRESDCMKVVSFAAKGARGRPAFAAATRALAGPPPAALWHLQEGKPIKECAQQVPECDGLRNAYSACKRGQLDARSRLRGNKGY